MPIIIISTIVEVFMRVLLVFTALKLIKALDIYIKKIKINIFLLYYTFFIWDIIKCGAIGHYHKSSRNFSKKLIKYCF